MAVRLSYSSITRFKQCPTKYYLSKEFKVKTMGSALPFGKAVDEAIGFLLENMDKEDVVDLAIQKFHTYWYKLPADDYEPERQVYESLDYSYYKSDYDKNCIDKEISLHLQDEAHRVLQVDDWEKAWKSISAKIVAGIATTEAESRFYNIVSWFCLDVKGELMIQAFADQVLPNIEEVVSVQQEVKLENEDGDYKIGYIDCVLKYKGYDTPVVFDVKTAARAYDRHALVSSEQLRGYVTAVQKDFPTNLMGYIVLLKKPKALKTCNVCGAEKEGLKRNCVSCGKGKYESICLEGETQVIIREVDDSELESLADDDMNVLAAIKHNVNFKNPASCNLFNRKCEYYSMCWEGAEGEDLSHLDKKDK